MFTVVSTAGLTGYLGLLLFSKQKRYLKAEAENRLDTVNYLDVKEWRYILKNVAIRALIMATIGLICAGAFFLPISDHENYWFVLTVKYGLFSAVTGFSLFYFNYLLQSRFRVLRGFTELRSSLYRSLLEEDKEGLQV